MSIESSLNDLKRTSKNIAKLEHKDDTDEQLREITVKNSRIIAALPNDNNGIIEGYKLLGETEACSEILAEREAKRKRIKDAKKKWKEDWPVRKEAAVLKLETAVSPNGQLIAAVLEDEDGKTAEELASWCDELASLDDESFAALLSGLEREGVIKKVAKDRYSLITVCEESLMRDSESEIEKAELFSEGRERQDARLITRMMHVEKTPLSAEECCDLQEEYKKLLADNPKFRENDFDMTSYDAEQAIRKMIRLGLVAKQFSIDRVDYCWFAMLGERGK